MATTLHIVFSKRPDDVSDEEFNKWYDLHLDEVLEVPGFVAVQRFRLAPVVTDRDTSTPWDYLALWEVDGDPDVAIEEQAKMGLSTKASYVAYKEARGGPPLPEWWDRVRFASWNSVAIGERVESAK
jgi:hypothetical protein